MRSDNGVIVLLQYLATVSAVTCLYWRYYRSLCQQFIERLLLCEHLNINVHGNHFFDNNCHIKEYTNFNCKQK